MPQSLSKVIMHIVFSTKGRKAFISAELETELYKIINSVCTENNSYCYSVGGMSDHIHIACELPQTLSISDLVKTIKISTSLWFSETKNLHDFSWQSGYGVFSVSQSHLNGLIDYIDQQAKHHQRINFQDEFRKLLKRHQVEFNETYVWD
ncbi:MAG: IS200/IS605 family transposase [Lentisphaeria bacterium]|nr:IS200/IS605 family transposase [Lentisphaeria bacterium]NQZ68815.1 IS200/IS605 family transposase [Lentisphaeria bacterium]